jgi:GTP diphosphokinase / guanosine-3',5'-bis(diphosphate) 3'-diphosphatase
VTSAGPVTMRLFKKLRIKLNYLDKTQIDQIHEAFLIALEAHRDQKRNTGEPYITHPVAVACILADMKLDANTVMAALLHDVIEDTATTKADLASKFGEVVADLVDGVSKLTQIEFFSKAEAQAENFRKMVLAMAKDIRVIIIKLADRLHNMRTLSSLPAEKRRRISQETMEIFAPIARRLGMYDFAVELEELSFMSHNPRRYGVLRKVVEESRGERQKVLNLVSKTLQEGLAKARLPSCTVVGREKSFYSIYKKMRGKHRHFNEILDVYAFRIIVDDVDTCYRVLGLVHRLFKPVPEKFKDYIAIPKANGYQSLHTILFGPYGYPIEIQIRTTEMDQHATSGIAAHWLYKNKEQTDSAQMRAQQWVKNLIELQKDSGSSLEFIESVKLDLFPDEVYVFTPRGKIMRLPSSATAVDFAYAVHTDIGNSCVGAKINRQPAPLSSPLLSGQTVEIITNPKAQPNPAWLDFVVTRQARNNIRHYLKNQRQVESVALGENLLKQALRQNHLNLKKIPKEALQFLLAETKLNSLIELLADIGLGNRPPALVAKRIADLTAQYSGKEPEQEPDTEKSLIIKGTEGMVLNFAECCSPIPGDPIIGLMQSGEGIMVHAEQCWRLNKLREHPEAFMALRWDEHIDQTFPAIIQVEAIDEPRLLAKMAAAIADAQANISDVKVQNQGGLHYQLTFKLAVRNRVHLARVIKQLRLIPAVTRISRGLAEEKAYETNH